MEDTTHSQPEPVPETRNLHAHREVLTREEQTQSESENRYRYLFENNPQPMLLYDLDTLAIMEVNEALVQSYGYSREEFLAMTIKDIRPPEDIPALLENIAQTVTTIDDSGKGRHRKKDGSLIDVEITSHTFDYSGKPARLVLINDVTERNHAEREILQRNAALAALNQVGQAMGKLATQDEILEVIYENIGHVLDNRNLYIALYDEARRQIAFPIYTIEGERRSVASRAFGNGLTEYIIRTKQPLLIRSEVKENLEKLGIATLGQRSHSLLSVPMLAEGQIIGVITIQDYHRAMVYDTAHLELLSTFAAQAAIAIVNARLYAAEQQRAHELRALTAIGQRLTGVLDLATVLRDLLDETAQIVPGHALAIMLFDAAREELWIETARGYLGETWRDFRVRLGEGVTGRVAAMRQPALIRDAANDPHWLGIGDMPLSRSELAVPLVSRNRLVGVINVESKRPAAFDEHHLTLLTAIADHAAIAIENAQLFEREQARVEELGALYSLARTLADSRELDNVLQSIARGAVETIHVTFARIFLVEGNELVIRFVYPFRVLDCDLQLGRREALDTHPYLHRLLRQNEPVALSQDALDLTAAERELLLLDFVKTVCLVPFRIGAHVGGLLMLGEVRNPNREPFNADKLRLARSIGDQAASAIQRVLLFQQTVRDAEELAHAYDATIEGWSRALDLRDKETQGHTQRVTELTVRLARVFGMNDDLLVHVQRGALLHDIGKMGIPDAILLKPGPLTDIEWVIMRQHPTIAYELLAPIAYLQPALDIPYCHHEKWDGTGYPRGLRGEEIPLAARVFMVVDVWDALRSDRPYRSAWSAEKACQHILSLAGTHFSHEIVELFLDVVSNGDERTTDSVISLGLSLRRAEKQKHADAAIPPGDNRVRDRS
ncbi:MAG: GAF domain-containing protein [Chloroflexi bacterium]|nr:GAF domain-containing protein [Chloroflexota bacterium]